jgi:hypothetical protein
MPLKPGRSEKAISANIKELSHSTTKAGLARNANPSGHAMAVAIAMKQADKSGKPQRARPVHPGGYGARMAAQAQHPHKNLGAWLHPAKGKP